MVTGVAAASQETAVAVGGTKERIDGAPAAAKSERCLRHADDRRGPADATCDSPASTAAPSLSAPSPPPATSVSAPPSAFSSPRRPTGPMEVTIDEAYAAAAAAAVAADAATLASSDSSERLGAEDEAAEGGGPPLTTIETLADILPEARAFSDVSEPSRIRAICRASVPGWGGAAGPVLRVSQIMIGLSNQLFKVEAVDGAAAEGAVPAPTSPPPSPRCVLFRVYGKDCNELYDTAAELANVQALAARGIAPQIIATFPAGRIEEWIEGAPLKNADMGKKRVLASIAHLLANLHEMRDLPGSAGGPPAPEAPAAAAATAPAAAAALLAPSASPSAALPPPARPPASPLALYSILSRWSASAAAVAETLRQHTPTLLDVHRLNLPALRAEAAHMRQLLFPPSAAATPLTEPAFCHNDMQENNVMVWPNGMRLIDFEFSGLSFPAYDFALYFWEMSCDYAFPRYPFFRIDSARLPREDQQRYALAAYLSRRLHRRVAERSPETTAALDAVRRFGLAAHLVWIFWGVIRSPQAPTVNDFDMLYYAQKRADCYWRLKKRLIDEGLVSDWRQEGDELAALGDGGDGGGGADGGAGSAVSAAVGAAS